MNEYKPGVSIRGELIWDVFPGHFDGVVNEEFYADKVCRCNEGLVTRVCRRFECGKPSVFNLSICRGCDSLFYENFRHPDQLVSMFNLEAPGTGFRPKAMDRGIGKSCWHCLEGREITADDYPYPKSLILVPPPIHLLNPYIIPPTLEDRTNTLQSSMDELDSLFDYD